VVYVGQIEGVRNAYNILVGKVKGRDHFGDLDTGERIILKLALKNSVRG
jgi:hypothetical protein